MEEMKSRVYILVDEQNRVIRLEGEYSLPTDLTDWILIEEGAPCDRLNLAQSHYLEKSLMTEDGIYQYKWNGESVVERTEEEIEADREAMPKPEESTEDLVLELMADHEERICYLELGI